MKPKNYEKKAAKNTARVKMLIKSRLSWLSGYPHCEKDQLVWVVSESGFYCDKSIHIDSRTISLTQRTINTLYRDYPVALPSVVGDADAWHQRCCTYLDHAKQLLVAQSDEVFSLFDQEKSYRHGLNINSYLNHERKDVLTKLSWKNYIDRSDLNKSLSFFHSHPDIYHKISDKSLINLIGLHCIDPKKSHELIDFVLTAGMSTENTNTTCHTKFSWFSPYLKKITPKNIKKHKKTFDPVDFPTADNHTIILNFIHCLSSFNKVRIVRALSIFGQLSLKEPFNQWQYWWVTVRSTCEKIKNHITFSDCSDSQLKKIYELQNHLKKLHNNQPQETALADVFTAITYFSQYKNVSSALTLLLSTITTKKTLFPAGQLLLVYFHGLLKWENHKNSKISHYLMTLNNFIRQIEHTDETFPWSTIPQYHWNNIDCTLLEIADSQQITSFFDTLTSLYLQEDIQLKSTELKSILHLHQANYAPIEVTDILKTMRTKKIDEPLPKHVCHIAKGLHLESTEIIALYQLHEKLYNTDFFDECLMQLFHLFKDMDALDHFKSLLFKMPIAKIFSIYSLVQVVTKKSGADFIPTLSKVGEHFEEWIMQYPSPLRKRIAQLNSLSSESKKWLNHILKNIWWTEEMITSEITSLRSILNQPKPNISNNSIKKRLTKYQNQLKNHTSITSDQIKKIKNKIDVKINQELFFQWQSQLEKQFMIDWSSIFKIPHNEVPGWLIDPQMVAKLLPILNFGSSSRNLAIKVIKERIKKIYYFIENNQNNTAFIKKLKSESINWPIKINDYTYEAKNGETITIAVESDPLLVLDMGGHFGTCLSPGHMNYFSVFANIADVNKLVIYAKNKQNKVVGRVLLGITDQGGLQVFNRYTHHKDFEFHEHAQLFINDIARLTGLIITKIGYVTPLCGASWYDDGPDNISHDIDCFRPNSTFRQQLDSMPAQDFEKRVYEEIKPKQMNSMVFSLLLQLPEIMSNRNLFKPLTHMSLSIQNVATHDLIALFKIANKYNNGAELYSIHRKQILNYQLKLVNEYWFDYNSVIQLIAEHHPSDALKIIKAHSKINKLDWKKQPIYQAISATVIALNNLGRHELAEKIASKKAY